MRVSSDQILLALQSTWKRNEEINSFVIMHVARGKEDSGVPHPKPGSPMSVPHIWPLTGKGGLAHTCHHSAQVTRATRSSLCLSASWFTLGLLFLSMLRDTYKLLFFLGGGTHTA